MLLSGTGLASFPMETAAAIATTATLLLASLVDGVSSPTGYPLRCFSDQLTAGTFHEGPC